MRATNNGGAADAKSSPVGPGTQWAAVGQPAAWDEGSWAAVPTGANAQAQVRFTVPPSRGAQSQVSILVDGVVRDTAQRTGSQTVNISVGDNDRAHAIQLQVCNEKANCSLSGSKAVQAYGPFASNHIISAQEHVREVDVNTYEVYWTITVDNNGDPGRVDITSRSGDSDAIRDESYTMSSVDVQSFNTRTVRLDAFKSDIILVHLYDTSPARAEVKKEFRYTTPERKQPAVSVTPGQPLQRQRGQSLPRLQRRRRRHRLLGLRVRADQADHGQLHRRPDPLRVLRRAVASSARSAGSTSNTTVEPGAYYGNSGQNDLGHLQRRDLTTTTDWP